MESKKQHEPKSLQEAIVFFADPDRCIDYLAVRRWPNGVTCPTCGSAHVSFNASRRTWKCSSHHSRREFSIKVGTVMEDSAISLEKWLPAIWLLTNCKNGISSYELARALKVTQKSAWFMLHRIRLAMKSELAEMIGGNGGPVEADETFVGSNAMKMHKSKRAKLQAIASNTYGMNRHAIGKTIVMGMLDREAREVRACVIPDVKRATLQDRILNNVKGGSTVITDDATGYRFALADGFVHEVINHAQEYVRGQVHTQGIENFWSLLKRGLRGTYVAVEPFHLDRYVDEQVFRFNNRKRGNKQLTDADRFEKLVSQVVGKRLTFAELTGKTTTTQA